MKPVVIIAVIVGVIGVMSFLFIGNIIGFNQQRLEESIQNMPQNIQETVDSTQKQIKDSPKSVPSDIEKSLSPAQDVIKDVVKTVQPEIKDTIESSQNKITEAIEPLIPIDSQKSHDELVQYALEKINEDRAKNNLNSVLLSYNSAAQIHAEDILKTRMISHWMTNGEKPYMTYSRLGGTGDVIQNVGYSGYADPEECTNYNVICEKIDPFDSIAKSEYGMMYDDASSDWGHRDNILQPYHTHVSLGIAYDDYTFVFVQNFEDNYLVSNNPISVTGNHVTINSELKSGSIQNIGIFYDPLPTLELYLQHRNDGSYQLGDKIAVVVSPPPPNSYYNQPTEYPLIKADRWSTSGNSVLIDFDLSSVLTIPGVYTMGVWVDEGGESFLITSYSIFYKG